jgi:hypothetical protein
MTTLTCASQLQSGADPLATAALLQIGGQLYVAGATRQHRSRLEGTSSCRCRCPPHTCCSTEKEVPPHRTSPTSPAKYRNKMLDAIVNLLKQPWQIIVTYTRGLEPVELVSELFVRPIHSCVRNSNLVPTVCPRRLSTFVLIWELVTWSHHLRTDNRKMLPHP